MQYLRQCYQTWRGPDRAALGDVGEAPNTAGTEPIAGGEPRKDEIAGGGKGGFAGEKWSVSPVTW